MSEMRPTRHQRGVAQDFANQLAQMSVGWRIVNDSRVLISEPEKGVIDIDAIAGSAAVNGRPTDLMMARELHHWTVEELKRKELETSWLRMAKVEVRYVRSKRTEKVHSLELTAEARIESSYGEASASFNNTQPLVGPSMGR
jgi:hypothetical protein